MSQVDVFSPVPQYNTTILVSETATVTSSTDIVSLSLVVPSAQLWTPTSPVLYNLAVTLVDTDGTTVLDRVESYAGIRSISLGRLEDGSTVPLLNGNFLYQLGTLDQGFWPDGNYAAPTDEALRFDIAAHKELGFNMVRKHIKVQAQYP